MLDQQVEVCLYDFKMQVLSSTAVKDICVWSLNSMNDDLLTKQEYVVLDKQYLGKINLVKTLGLTYVSPESGLFSVHVLMRLTVGNS
jgi:hypothetical protein